MPEAFVMNVRSTFLSRSRTVTAASGTTAPDGSVTLPVTSAEFVAWAHVVAGSIAAMQAQKASILPRDCVDILSVSLPKALASYERFRPESTQFLKGLLTISHR